jgi:hypothetical protein
MGWEKVKWCTWFMSTSGVSCDNGNEHCGFIRHREFHIQLSDYLASQENCAVWILSTKMHTVFFFWQVRDDWSEVGPTEDWISMDDLDGKTYCRYPGTWRGFTEVHNIMEVTCKIKHVIGRQHKQISNCVTVMSMGHYVKVILPQTSLCPCFQHDVR